MSNISHATVLTRTMSAEEIQSASAYISESLACCSANLTLRGLARKIVLVLTDPHADADDEYEGVYHILDVEGRSVDACIYAAEQVTYYRYFATRRANERPESNADSGIS
jgi:hypothetical protein